MRILWELSTECNLGCDFCHTKVDRGGAQRLGLAEIQARLGSLAALGVSDVIFSGGEPLLHPHLFPILESAAALGFHLDLCTNGTLATADTARLLSGLLTEISVSFDASQKATFEKMRGIGGSYEQVLRGITCLQKAGLEIHGIIMVDARSFLHLKNTVSSLEAMGIHSVTLLGRMQTEPLDGAPSWRVDSRVLQDALGDLRAVSRIPVNTKRLLFTPTRFRCPAGTAFRSIDSKGRLLPCILMKNMTPELLDSWVTEFEADKASRCGHCEYRSWCGGGCPGAACLFGHASQVDVLCPHRQSG
jgi:radical SAM protein with 4Fe4S-binding SPASM domain